MTPPRREVRFTVGTGTIVRVLVALGLAYLMVTTLLDVLVWTFVSVLAAFALNPLVVALQRRGRSRAVSALIVFGGAVLGVIGLTLLFAGPIWNRLYDLVASLPAYVEELRGTEGFQELDERYDLGAKVQEWAIELLQWLPQGLSGFLEIIGGLAGSLLAIFTIATLAFYLLVELPRILEWVASVLSPETARRFDRLQTQIGYTVAHYVAGALAIAFIAGTLVTVSLLVLGVPHALALGVVVALLDLIPQIGATIGGAIVVLCTLASTGTLEAVVMLIVILVYQQLENNVVQPLIQRRATSVSAFVVVFSVVVGSALLGVIGALIAVPVAASIQIVIADLTAERRARSQAARAAADGLDEQAALPPAPAG